MSDITYDEVQDLIGELVKSECLRRDALYRAMRPDIEDGRSPDEKADFLLLNLKRWDEDPEQFIRDMAWAHDTKGRFGAASVPEDCIAPPGMVPIIPYPIQCELIGEWKTMMASPVEMALVAEKSRQLAFTILFGWLGLHEWLFKKNGKGVLTTYDKDLVDGGGKGSRTEDTLFGQARCFLDAMCFCVPELRFNKQRRARRGEDGATQCGLVDSQDVSMKLTRPAWFVFGQRLFPQAEGNYLRGDIPGDSFSRGTKPKFVIMDEIGQYNEKEAERDKRTWASAQIAAKHRIAGGTLPKQGGKGSFFHQLVWSEEFAEVAKQFSIHWSYILPYMAGAKWICRSCAHHNHQPPNESPGRRGVQKTCEQCGITQRVGFRDITSPWFRRMCKFLLNDKVAIARELQLDWGASQGDTLFENLGEPFEIPFRDSSQSVTIEGFDPGQSMKNPGAWVCHRFSPSAHRLCTVGYWMATSKHPEYWVPFLKHWDRKAVRRNRILYGKLAGRTFMEAFDYPEEALKMLDHVAKFPLGDIRGDKYGSHGTPGRTTYDVFSDYGIEVWWEKTKDREDLVRNGVEWGARLVIDAAIADIEPPTPLGGRFPSVSTCFQSAKPIETDSEGRRPFDVSKKNPPFVHGLVDAHLYAVRELENVHAMVNAGGDWSEEPLSEPESVDFGDSFLG